MEFGAVRQDVRPPQEVGLCAMLRLREQVAERYLSVGGDVILVYGI